MLKKEPLRTHPMRRINLSLPIVQTDSYEIYYTVPPSQTRQSLNAHPLIHQKPLIDNKIYKKSHNHPITTTTVRPPGRLKHPTGPVLVNLFVNMPAMPIDTTATMADTISNALINSGYSEQTLHAVTTMAKRNKRQTMKDDGEHSQGSSGDRLLYESVGSFEDPLITKAKNGMWQNTHHPQLTTVKVLHTRRIEKRKFLPNDMYLRVPNSSSLDNRSQESCIPSGDRLHDRIEQLTKNYFPTIQQLRHAHPCPELLNNRMHLHREEKKDFVPEHFRARAVR